MVARRWIVAGFAAAWTLLAGCAAGAAAPARVDHGPDPDPERWDRAACQHGTYPSALDDGALARAHLEDLRARGRGEWSPFAAARLEDARAAFRARCERWERQARLPGSDAR